MALVLYDKLLPGSQLVNRLQDLNYRVHSISDPSQLVAAAISSRPMVVFADLQPDSEKTCAAIADLKKNPETNHLPVVAFCAETSAHLYPAAQAAGVTLISSDAAVVHHLPQLLEQALQVE
jgi:CheY-like chemotaxis protein